MWESGSNDVEYEKYKRENGMIELTDFNSQTTDEITLVVEQSWRGRVLKFKCVYDSDNDDNFDEKDYFEADKILLGLFGVISSKRRIIPNVSIEETELLIEGVIFDVSGRSEQLCPKCKVPMKPLYDKMACFKCMTHTP